MSDSPNRDPREIAAYEDAFQFTLYEEGVRLPRSTGYVNDPVDPGGETNYGVTYGRWMAFLSNRLRPRIPIVDMSLSDARQIYFGDWRDSAASKIAAERPLLALCQFDWSFNGGTVRARWYLQSALGVVVDGIVGPKTLAAAMTCDEAATISRYLELRAAHYHMRSVSTLADPSEQKLTEALLRRVSPVGNATQKRFLNGWLARCRHVARKCGVGEHPTFVRGAGVIAA